MSGRSLRNPTVYAVWGVNLLLLCLAFPLGAHYFRNPFQFNQFLIQRLEVRALTASFEQITDTVRSGYSSGLNILTGNTKSGPPHFDEQREMFSYIFSWLPTYAVVYPTEGFYYFLTDVPEVGKISGNIRVADLDKGKLTMAYFTVSDSEERETRYLTITEEDGLSIHKLSDFRYKVGFEGKVVNFKLPQPEIGLPANFRSVPGEEFIGTVHDESGVHLYLLYNENTTSFYYVLNESSGIRETLEPTEGRYLLGKRTAFVYYGDAEYDRKLLVGVLLDNVKANNFYDGPADQVPFRADLRERLHIAYPNTMLGAGIDSHGVYLDTDTWKRIAISPYLRYTSIPQLLDRTGRCDGVTEVSERWTCLTKEWWNHDAWRAGILKRLQAEGKTIPPQLQSEVR